MSTLFSILDVGRRSMQSHQAAIQVSQHNIGNSSNPNYHRQIANIVATPSTGSSGISSLGRTVQLGTGVALEHIDRKRDIFIDTQIRQVDQRLGRLSEEQVGLERVETVFNEVTGGSDLNVTLADFWNAWETLAQEPSNLAFRADLRSKAEALTNDMRNSYAELEMIQSTYRSDVDIRVDRVNSLLSQLAEVHDDIGKSAGGVIEANDLLDIRDEIVGEISTLIDVRIFEKANGSVLLTLDGHPLIQELSYKNLKVINKPIPEGQEGLPAIRRSLAKIVLEEGGRDVDINIKGGSVSGVLRLQDEVIPEMMEKMDKLAYNLIREVNQIHQDGTGLNGDTKVSFFKFNLPDANGSLVHGTEETLPPSDSPPTRVAATIELTGKIKNDLSSIAAARSSAKGDNRNASKIAQVRDEMLFGNGTLNLTDFYNLSIAELGNITAENNRLIKSTQVVRDQLETRFQDISGVSLDEELVNIMQFQSVFEAAARLVSTIDRMTDVVINQMAV